MQVPTCQRKVSAVDLPLEKLAGSTAISEKEKVAEVSRQFEAVLLRQILAEGQKPLLAAKAQPDSASASIYRDILTNQMADSISHSHALGLSRTLSRELGRELRLAPPPNPPPPRP